ncbi:MAG: NapC/NirT family cytochrome c [Deltaproteobacteria bacterium]|nr:NapC/NirT family cytochrome c [Deltaproteobacteria bacterium]
MTPVLLSLITLSVVLAAALVWRPSLVAGTRGRILTFLALFLLPVLALAFGANLHLEKSKTTEFCLSCHVMEPYGESLQLEEREYLPAVHFQNSLVSREHACFTCHTHYTMYGDLQAKVAGVKHLWVNYFGTPGEPIELYEPYRNRECLHCHGGARSFEEAEFHADIRAELTTDETSCLECHEFVHAVEELDGLEKWSLEGSS